MISFNQIILVVPVKMKKGSKKFSKLLRLIAVTFLFVNHCNFGQANTKGFQALNEDAAFSGTIRAVIVGISHYHNIPSLNYADRDALAFYHYLTSPAGGKVSTENIHMLTDSEATAIQIFSALDWLEDQSKKGDIAIFYFSGHGDVEKKTNYHNGFLLAYDSQEAGYMAGGTVQIINLKGYLNSIASSGVHVILVADACHAGKLVGGIEGAKETALALQVNWNNTINILSCQPGEVSYEDKKWENGHGVFTYYLLKGLKGMADWEGDRNNKVSLSELEMYIKTKVKNDTKDYNPVQYPVVVGNPGTIVANVDSVTLATMLKEGVHKPSGRLIAMEVRGLSQADVDTVAAKLEGKFQNYIKSGNLIAPEGSEGYGNSAWEVFIKLKKHEGDKTIINSFKDALLSSLQVKAQNVIKGELDGTYDYHTKPVYVRDAFRELEHAYKLVDSTYIPYKRIKTQFLFLNAICSFDRNEAIRYLEEGIRIQPDAAYLYDQLGEFYIDAERFRSAKAALLKAIDFAPKWIYPWSHLGDLFVGTGQYDSAIVYYKKVIDLKPGYARGFNKLGIAYQHLKNYTEAIENFDKAFTIDTNSAEAYYNLACVYSINKDEANCLKYLNKTLNLGYKDISQLTDNQYLDNVRNSKGFKKLIEKYTKRYRASAPI